MGGSESNGIARGGGHLDPANNGEHRGAITQAQRRWPKRFAAIDEKKRSQWVDALDVAEKVARRIISNDGVTHMVDTDGTVEAVFESPLEAAKVLVSVVRAGGALDAAQQRDEHAEAGIVDNNVTINNNTIIAIPPPVRARITDD